MSWKPPASKEDAQGHPLRQQFTPKAPDQELIFGELGVRVRWYNINCQVGPLNNIYLTYCTQTLIDKYIIWVVVYSWNFSSGDEAK